MDSQIAKYLLTFEEFFTPKIVTVIYYIGLVFIVLGTLGSLFGPTPFTMKLISLFIGFPLAILFWRMACEFMLLAFRVYERLGDIRDSLSK